MKIALVYDRINKFGGAERLLLSLHRLYPDAPIYTLVHEPKTSHWAEDIRITPTFLNRVSFLRSKHEWLAPIAPLAFETHDLSEFEVVISITSGDAKSIITRPHQLHVCYCLTPTRYFWSGVSEYKEDKKLKYIPAVIREYFKSVDLVISQRPDEYISISNEVQDRVKKYYKRTSKVVYPPIEDKFYTKTQISPDNRDYYLIVSRLVPYKKVDLAISTFNRLKLPLIVVGIGSEQRKLKKMAGNNISFVGAVDDRQLIQYYRHAKALIFPQEEDFGLVPLESQASGTPVIAYAKGGALETVISGQTGYFFDEQNEESLSLAIHQFEKKLLRPETCVQNAERFNFNAFSSRFSEMINSYYESYKVSS
ncbi:hypothetical protein A3K29_03200 [Candidatus Collierbacteria bacterium RIFOXYB2_FULL_46_14]|uniref:Glycosyl transferase group 1 n=1 Tax=Candidatus Collierbacteria bacterium GW2011_GWA2_46_26 TaxID=1618381 RepID=A0A0G1RV01_9BACT|nr:MAG: Glycosyl transferase group 1 [Candidatus Collierbacteria bacterium GW2011_GWC2_44_13]KKU33803.1 MAG: Glycosyl transferase group 1 [Candidatus Collierbacteria bacterium GW2011_GWA2_46_26]OGD73126.1 MAG: hypothetical protein A3K29_03200 [Candidatus Collierbacteria bacterium RIFOXYB2_FULL_46_14]OGD76168.1 MAG: hypothetical protein A3K43_03200 [Candidatus Collierbacteria bacterium RIFOXYA2_FULL_46_20]OGD77504.1 MAG: hypothetical protein A3K39_03200 [Candidatus Collierbacteria bacterium RIFO